MLKLIHANVGHSLAQIQQKALAEAPLDVQRIMRNYAESLCTEYFIKPYELGLVVHFSDATSTHNVTAISEWCYKQAQNFYAMSRMELADALYRQQGEFRAHLTQEINRSLHSIELDAINHH